MTSHSRVNAVRIVRRNASRKRTLALVVPALVLALSSDPSAAGRRYVYEVVTAFEPTIRFPQGALPQRLLQASDGNFYGTTASGGIADKGTVFRIDAAGTFTTLHHFTGSEGGPSALIQGGDGSLYGTTGQGGAFGKGTIFKLDVAGALTRLYSFTISDGPSYAPLLLASDGSFYGTTLGFGQSENAGTIFKFDGAGTFTRVHSFEGAGSEGYEVIAGLIQASDGSLYGTTAGEPGTIFRVDLSGKFTTLHRFNGRDGAHPQGLLIQASDGSFYGTTRSGGVPSAAGTIFRFNEMTGLTTVHALTFRDGTFPDGAGPVGLIQARDGNIYGTTAASPFGSGTLFTIDATGTFSTVQHFASAGSPGELIQANDGTLYGTTSRGVVEGRGTLGGYPVATESLVVIG